MSSNRALLKNIKDTAKPINIYSSGGATHYSTAGTLKNIGDVYLHKKGLENILSYEKVKDKHNIIYDNMRDSSTVHSPYKNIHLQKIKRELYYHNCKPNGKKPDVTFVHTVWEKKEGFTNREIRDKEKSRSAYNMVGRSSSADFESMVRGNIFKNISISVTDI